MLPICINTFALRNYNPGQKVGRKIRKELGAYVQVHDSEIIKPPVYLSHCVVIYQTLLQIYWIHTEMRLAGSYL